MPPAPLRRRYSAATKRALLDVAAAQFAEHGYAGTSLDVVVAGAQVTKGALYHHFAGKQALFEDVFARVEEDAAARIRAAMTSAGDPWDQARSALRAFLDVVREPAYRRVVLQDGPAVLGHERFREQEERTSRALVHEVTERVLVASAEVVDPAMVDTFSRILYGAVSAAGEQVASAADPTAETLRVECALGVVLDGLRQQATAGLRLTDPVAAP
ncbi:TetR/AcrR family transcriptional regulator [Nocardioides aequoreus]|uniref:TetR/AcrR family transcriptional regulator n=1 Tax=Nocardioides aequoreus TaxID=397278 RepID=UPI00068BA8EA|nr:TetR/AcrR family transcriptional regulator [Nocardioides aequoreus]